MLAELTQEEAENLLYNWPFWARPAQRSPEWDWYVWLILSGRGFGKTRTGAETVRGWAKAGYSPIALVGQTKADVRDVMIEQGITSIMRVSPPWFYPTYEPSKRRLTWPNGVVAVAYSGDEPGQLRGPGHQKAWVDELAKFKYPQETWDNLMLGLREGDDPQGIVTTTPKPIKLIKDLIKDPRTAVTRGSTFENAENLSGDFLRYITTRYAGTRLGRQELEGELLEDNPNALWKRSDIDNYRVKPENLPALFKVGVGVDPEATSGPDSAETGIVVAGIAYVGDVLHGYVLDDFSRRGTPAQWATAAISGFYKHGAGCIIGEVNNGGEMVGYTVQTIDPTVPFKAVHASRGKWTRAEPVSALYEQGRIHHVGAFGDLEDQLCEWEPGDKSPDRLDALVWILTELIIAVEQNYEIHAEYDSVAAAGAITPELDGW